MLDVFYSFVSFIESMENISLKFMWHENKSKGIVFYESLFLLSILYILRLFKISILNQCQAGW